MKMNLPNKLTVARIVATPVFMLFMLLGFKGHYIVALLLFIAASLTDMFDGQYARKHNIVTDFGKFLDPLADKMLTTAAFIAFTYKGIGEGTVWVLFIILFREFLISSLRLVAVSSGGKVIAANMWGKLKTVSQMVTIIYILTAEIVKEFIQISWLSGILDGLATALLWITAALTVVSGAIYLWNGRDFVNPEK